MPVRCECRGKGKRCDRVHVMHDVRFFLSCITPTIYIARVSYHHFEGTTCILCISVSDTGSTFDLFLQYHQLALRKHLHVLRASLQFHCNHSKQSAFSRSLLPDLYLCASPAYCYMTMKGIPQEIIDAIIGHLRLYMPLSGHNVLAGHNALRNCALIAKSWAHRSQHYLFEDIAIKNRESCARFHAVLAASPHLTQSVRRLHVQASGEHIWFGKPEHHLYELLEMCSLLEHIAIRCYKLLEVQPLVARLPTHLQSIMLSYCRFSSASQLRGMVASAGERDLLTLNNIQVTTSEAPLPTEPPAAERIAVRKMWFHNVDFGNHGSAIGEALSPSTGNCGIRSLQATIAYGSEIPVLSEMIKNRGAELTHLHLDTQAYQGADEYSKWSSGMISHKTQ